MAGTSTSDVAPDGATVATGGGDGAVKLWEVTTGEQRMTLAHRGPLDDIAFSPDSKILLTASIDQQRPVHAGEVRLWNVATGTERLRVQGFGPVRFHPDGKLFTSMTPAATLSYTPSRSVELRDTNTGNILASVIAPTSWPRLAFSRNGKLMAVGGEFTIKLWDVGKLLRDGR